MRRPRHRAKTHAGLIVFLVALPVVIVAELLIAVLVFHGHSWLIPGL